MLDLCRIFLAKIFFAKILHAQLFFPKIFFAKILRAKIILQKKVEFSDVAPCTNLCKIFFSVEILFT